MDILISVRNTLKRAFKGPAARDPHGLEALSHELILRIASHLDRDDTLALRQASRALAAAVGSATRSLPVTTALAPALFPHPPANFAPRLAARFPRLRHLHCAAPGPLLRAFFATFAPPHPHPLPAVTGLTIACKPGLTPAHLTLAAAACPALTALSLDAFAFSPAPFPALAALTRLTALTLRLLRRSSLFPWDDAHLATLATLPHLRALTLHADSLLTSPSYPALASITALHSLSLHAAHAICPADLRSLARLPHLTSLHLEACSVRSAAALPPLTRLPRLRSLTLHLLEAPLPPATRPLHPLTFCDDFFADLAPLTALTALSLQGFLDLHSPHPLPLPQLAALTLQGPPHPSSSPTTSSSSSHATHHPPAGPPTPHPHSPLARLPDALASLHLSKALRTLALTHWYYLPPAILRLLPQFTALEDATVACLPHLCYSDLAHLRPMRALTSLTLHTANNRLPPDACARVQSLLGRKPLALRIVEEPAAAGHDPV